MTRWLTKSRAANENPLIQLRDAVVVDAQYRARSGIVLPQLIYLGGGYHGNKISVSLDYSVLFFPIGGKGFQQTTLQVSLRVHDTARNFQTNVDPMMRVTYTIYASSCLQGRLAGRAMDNHSHSAWH